MPSGLNTLGEIMDRRLFLKAITAGVGIYGLNKTLNILDEKYSHHYLDGQLKSTNHSIGHKIRDNSINSKSTKTIKKEVVIVGGGVAGFSAAWMLNKHHINDFIILELENKIGGNSSYEENNITPYPTGAHYLPLPNKESIHVRELLYDIGAIVSGQFDEYPVYDEKLIVHAPQERIWVHNDWQEGGFPIITNQDSHAFYEFENKITQYKEKNIFKIPVIYGKIEPELFSYSMYDWLNKNKLTNPSLHWYVNYSCRDDYGVSYKQIPAYFGLHYFASRTGKGKNINEHSVMVSTKGNGWIIDKIKEKLSKDSIKTNNAVFRIEQENGKYLVHTHENGNSITYKAEQVIWAAPMFVGKHVLAGVFPELQKTASNMEYAPWIISNITLKEPLQEKTKIPLSWDNLIYNSEGLGYVNTLHQEISTNLKNKIMLTHYNAPTNDNSKQTRSELLNASWESLSKNVIKDLSIPHPNIRHQIEAIDIMIRGHAMTYPLLGVQNFYNTTEIAQKAPKNLFIAHSDLSSYSIFEEANYWGVKAAKQIIKLRS